MLLQVDAALDLSHTQNIGRMIKTHFPYSQFIVVSLKEGMFSNANVIFRTKFVDGVSAVTRSANSSKCAPSLSCTLILKGMLRNAGSINALPLCRKSLILKT